MRSLGDFPEFVCTTSPSIFVRRGPMARYFLARISKSFDLSRSMCSKYSLQPGSMSGYFCGGDLNRLAPSIILRRWSMSLAFFCIWFTSDSNFAMAWNMKSDWSYKVHLNEGLTITKTCFLQYFYWCHSPQISWTLGSRQSPQRPKFTEVSNKCFKYNTFKTRP